MRMPPRECGADSRYTYMSLKDITNKIIEDAKIEAAGIVSAIREEAALAAKQKDEEIAAAVRSIGAENARQEAKIKEQAEFRARMIEKNAILKAKQELIDEVIAEVKRKLYALDGDDFVRLMAAALKASPRIEGAEVITSAGKKPLLAAAVKKAGASYGFSGRTLPPDREGFVLASETVEVDNTIDNIVASRRESLEPAIVKTLFG